MKIEIGALEAKTKLPELVRQVQAGKRFTITSMGAI
jgi:antitoxin (DNA-binding transcriptional repressor) of toxin-antitoxin stability system